MKICAGCCFAAVLAVLASGCPSGSISAFLMGADELEIYNSQGNDGSARIYPQAYWGEWLRIDNGDKWYVSRSSVTAGGAEKTNVMLDAALSDYILKATEGSTDYYLSASRRAGASFTGTAAGLENMGGASSPRYLHYVNTKNSEDKGDAEISPEGAFTIASAIPGDTYALTIVDDSHTAHVTPYADGEDIGTITYVTGNVNFKTTITPDSSDQDMNELYAGEENDFYLLVENTGTEPCSAVLYEVTSSDVSVTSLAADNMLAIAPGQTGAVAVRIRVTCAADAIQQDSGFKKINITLTAGTETWHDSVSLKFHKKYANFNIVSEKDVCGALITPAGRTYRFETTQKTIQAPWRESQGEYYLVFFGIKDEDTKYSFAVDGTPGPLTEAAAAARSVSVSGSVLTRDAPPTVSSLSKGDIDCYSIKITGGYQVGDTGPAGGLVFYVDTAGFPSGAETPFHYLEAAPSDLSAVWGADEAVETDTALGTGQANTDAITASSAPAGAAAKVCDQLVNSMDDWFLPSRDELNLLYTNLKSKSKGGFSNVEYWSSSQSTESQSWAIDFKTGIAGTGSKDKAKSFRPIRGF
ncbi:MAG: DUF1566 domain-containing protein [Treponema sp.]|nr:DUF1566 domain-containing protein [Treponema sp.]